MTYGRTFGYFITTRKSDSRHTAVQVERAALAEGERGVRSRGTRGGNGSVVRN